MTLYFKSSRGEKRLVKENISQENAIPIICDYVKSLNPNYTIYYIRSWEDEDKNIHYDVGSWSEFFILSP